LIAPRGALFGHARLSAFERVDDFEGALVKDAAGLGQVHAPRRARQQVATEMLLQHADAVAHHGGGQAHDPAGLGEAAMLDGLHEDPDVLDHAAHRDLPIMGQFLIIFAKNKRSQNGQCA
jgi:hypothetical protein